MTLYDIYLNPLDQSFDEPKLVKSGVPRKGIGQMLKDLAKEYDTDPENFEIFKQSKLNENKMNKDFTRMLQLAGTPKPEKKQQLDENVGGVVSIGAINQIFDREKSDYEMAFEHFMGERYGDEEEVKEDYNPYEYERGIVHKVIDGVANDFSDTEMSTREYINAIITSLEELKVTDF